MTQLTLIASRLQLLDATHLLKGGMMRKRRFSLKLEPIEISPEEILADLRYPAPAAPTPRREKRAPDRRRVRS
jgi:hypothetical protein